MCMLYGAVRDCDIQFEASYGSAISRSLLGSTVSFSFLFIIFPSPLAHSFSGRNVQWTSVLWQVCMPITPETASSTSETGSLPGFRPYCRYTHTHTQYNTGIHISSYTFTRTALMCLVWLWNITSHLHYFIWILVWMSFCFLRKRGWTTILTPHQEHRLVRLYSGGLCCWFVLKDCLHKIISTVYKRPYQRMKMFSLL